MAKSTFPETLFVVMESDGKNEEENWFNVVSSLDVPIAIGEEKEVAEYRFVGKKKFRGTLEEV